MYEYKEISPRLMEVAYLRHYGKSFREIGECVGVSTERARQLFKKYEATRKFNEELDKQINSDSLLRMLCLAQHELETVPYLVTRTYNCIKRAHYDQDKVLNGEYPDEEFLSIRNFGVTCLELLHKAMDIYASKS